MTNNFAFLWDAPDFLLILRPQQFLTVRTKQGSKNSEMQLDGWFKQTHNFHTGDWGLFRRETQCFQRCNHVLLMSLMSSQHLPCAGEVFCRGLHAWVENLLLWEANIDMDGFTLELVVSPVYLMQTLKGTFCICLRRWGEQHSHWSLKMSEIHLLHRVHPQQHSQVYVLAWPTTTAGADSVYNNTKRQMLNA